MRPEVNLAKRLSKIFWLRPVSWEQGIMIKTRSGSLKSYLRNSHWVGSASFSRRKIGHAHDNSADSENVAGARQPNAHAHFIFSFENGQGNKSFLFYPYPKHSWNKSTTSSADGRLTRHRHGGFVRPPAALRKVWFSMALIVEKKKKERQTSWIV